MASPIIDLLKRTLSVGGSEVRLIPGRRTVVVTPQGASEVRGEAQTSDRVQAMLDPVLTPEARRSLSSGYAEWEFPLEDKGLARVRADVKAGQLSAHFFLDKCDLNGQRGIPRPAPPLPAYGMGSPSSAQIVEVDIDRAPALPSRPPITESRSSMPAVSSAGPTGEIDRLLKKLVEHKGSDLHMSVSAPPMIRKDGEMEALSGFPPLTQESMERMIMPIVPPRNKEEFARTHDSDFAYELPGICRFRANLFVDLKGIGAVFRVIPSKILSVEELGIPKEVLSLCHLPKGLVLVTGPTGSGKSTTLAALIDYINRVRSDHIITIEDPVEFVHPNKKCLINQRQVGEHTDSFKKALRAALREDPDIVLLGEMRDLETIAIALETAETGHLVFGTLHTSSAPATIDRIIDQYPPEQQAQIRVMLANSLKGVMAQMLCKKIGGGRAAAWEIMFGVPSISNLIREQKIFQIPSIMQTGRKLGMALMNDSLFKLVKDGLVAPEEALAKANDKPGLTQMFQAANIALPAAKTEL
ncbi:MAG TPA: type IV pilus twitching motility protein PilT [Polyangiaceae bacterium]|nr:type IV pilus twitching motility protein PilT [Polyangiaceae bacterium]